MKSIDVVDSKYSEPKSISWIDSISKKIILNTFRSLRVGHLALEDDGEVYAFGQDAKDTDIVAHISINHPSAYRYVLFRGTVGSGEAYMLNAWWSPDLLQVIRLFVSNMSTLGAMNSSWSGAYKLFDGFAHKMRTNSREGARKNISAHYDLGNDFFALFLDKHRMYSSAIYTDPKTSLDDASENKLAHICKRLDLNKGDHLLEIGTGWGGMAIYAAKNKGCKVTTVTISKEQYLYARNWVKRENLEHLVNVELKDYRDINSQTKYDKIVSIEMIEAVGHQYYTQFFRKCSSLLRPEGKMLIQAITIQDQRFSPQQNKADFIQTYIFPGGCLPSNAVVAKHVASDTDMQIIGMEDITLDYALTIAEWRRRFFAKLDNVKEQGFDEVFIRMWDFYLSYCEGGFRERVISTAQFLLAKPCARNLPVIG